MRPEEVKQLLDEVVAGKATAEDALRALRRPPVADLGFAKLDTHRELRQGLPEAIYGEGKSPAQVVSIARQMLESTTAPVLVTRTTPEVIREVTREWPDCIVHERARLLVLRPAPDSLPGTVQVVSAGTSDLGVAEEAAFTMQALGVEARLLGDVGVAGIHRVLEHHDTLSDADVVVVVAGMDGVLPSIVGGLTPAPVIAVPTSVGYGASFEGLAALLTMLNSCATGIAVTNIDNGFGAAMFAVRVLRNKAGLS